MKKIGIFCSASENIDKMYFASAKRIGRWLGETGCTVIYGGSDMGLMECVAQEVKASGGRLIGVVPRKLEENGRVSTLPDEIIHTCDLSDRKDMMVRESDLLLALPGGVGTLDEVFHTLAAASIGYYQKRVVFYNEGGFYNLLLEALNQMQAKGFSRKPMAEYYDVADSLEELKDIIHPCTGKEHVSTPSL